MPRYLGRVAATFTFLIMTTLISVATGTVSAAVPRLAEYTQINSATDGMGTSAAEWSGATYNADTNVLFVVDDGQTAYEFALDNNGKIDASVTPVAIDLDFGPVDFEGVAWVQDQTYGFLTERGGRVFIATVPPAGNNGRTSVGTDDVARSFQVITGTWGNLGPEGLATDGEAFFVAREKPATLTKFDFGGSHGSG